MLLHTCGAPVTVLDRDDPDFTSLQFFCEVCNKIVYDDHELFVVDSFTLLEEGMKR